MISAVLSAVRTVAVLLSFIIGYGGIVCAILAV